METITFPYEQIYSLSQQNKAHKALDVIFHCFDEAFCAGRFADVDEVLRDISIKKLDSNVAFGLLAASYAARQHLPSRLLCYERVRWHLISLKRSEKEADELLKGQL